MDEKLEKKIDELFEYREFPRLFEIAGQQYYDHGLITKMKNLQAAIYYLDHHLETNWEINPVKDLKPYWKEIYAALKECGVKKSQYDDYCKLIYKYQKHELYLREQRLPTSFKKEFYYYYKSCDVKLLRRIIGDHFPIVEKMYPSADWRCFDLITEVNDDVEDVFEDMRTINGNYVLIDFLENGVDKSSKNIRQFIKEISIKDKTRAEHSKNKNYAWISKLTQKECKQTTKLLKANMTTLKTNKKRIKMSSLLLTS